MIRSEFRDARIVRSCCAVGVRFGGTSGIVKMGDWNSERALSISPVPWEITASRYVLQRLNRSVLVLLSNLWILALRMSRHLRAADQLA